MNILPKKNWHVRTQKNIDRVRRDEAKAAEEEAERERRSKLAEQEARTRLLRERASTRNPVIIGPKLEEIQAESEDNSCKEIQDSTGHINFFQDVEQGEGKESGNKEHEAEKKREQEAYEKKVGYSVQLGQDTEELTGEKAWWKKQTTERLLEQTPSQLNSTTAPLSTIREKQKDFLDPLNNLRKYLGCEGVKLTMKKHEKKLQKEEERALNFESIKKQKKRKRSRSRSSNRSRDRSRHRRSRSRKRRKRNKSRDSSHKRKHKSKSKKKKRRKSTSTENDSDSSSSSDSDTQKKALAKKNLEKLRRERLERERVERQKADRLVFGECEEDRVKKKEEEEKAKKQKYTNQFNPEIAKQNKLDPKRKYWLD